MPDDFELTIEEPKTPDNEIPVKVDSGGEGDGGKPVSATDLLDLKKELEAAKADARRARDGETAATARTAQVEQEGSAKLKTELEQRISEQEATLDTAITSAQSEVESYRALAAKAMEEGKWAEAAEANENLGDAKARQRDLSTQKNNLASYKEKVKAEAVAPRAPAVGAKTQSWIAAHPRFNTDSVYRAEALLAHEKAIKAGIAPESDEYFEQVELATGDRKKVEPKVDPVVDKSGEGGDGKTPAKAEATPGVAPVTRRAGTPNSPAQARTIKLTGDQVEAADSLFGDPTNSIMYIKDPKERYTYWHSQQERLKSEGRL